MTLRVVCARYKYISPSTKITLLQELKARAVYEAEARAIVDALLLLEQIPGLLASSDTGIRRWACGLVGRLASHESSAPAILRLQPCAALVSLLRCVMITRFHRSFNNVGKSAIHIMLRSAGKQRMH